MTCPKRRLLIICAVEGLCGHATLDYVREYVLSKGDDGMPRPMLLDHVYCPQAMMECNAKHG